MYNKIQSLLDENNNFVYHYSNIKFDSIKTRGMLGLSAPKEASDSEKYIKQVSLTLAPIPVKIIKQYRSKNFTAWGKPGEPLYEYKINIIKNKNSFDGPIILTSTPEAKLFKHTVWSDFITKKGIDFKRMIKDDDYWNKIKKTYFEYVSKYWNHEFTKFNNKKYGILTPEKYLVSKPIKKIINNYPKYLQYNLLNGNKNQYASYIPHIHTKIKTPLIPEEVSKII